MLYRSNKSYERKDNKMRMEELFQANESEREREGRGRGRKTQRRFGGSDSLIEENEGLKRKGCASIIKGKHVHWSGGGSFAISWDFQLIFWFSLTDHSIRRSFQASWAISPVHHLDPRPPEPYPSVRVSNPSSEVAWYNIQLHSCK